MDGDRWPVLVRNRHVGGRWYLNGDTFPSKALAEFHIAQKTKTLVFAGTEYMVGESIQAAAHPSPTFSREV